MSDTTQRLRAYDKLKRLIEGGARDVRALAQEVGLREFEVEDAIRQHAFKAMTARKKQWKARNFARGWRGA